MTEKANSCRVDAAIELLENACDEVRDVIYSNGLYGNDYGILALLVDIYCRRSMRIGTDPQEGLEIFWPQEAPWVERQ